MIATTKTALGHHLFILEPAFLTGTSAYIQFEACTTCLTSSMGSDTNPTPDDPSVSFCNAEDSFTPSHLQAANDRPSRVQRQPVSSLPSPATLGHCTRACVYYGVRPKFNPLAALFPPFFSLLQQPNQPTNPPISPIWSGRPAATPSTLQRLIGNGYAPFIPTRSYRSQR
ncbi:uncharacterized protein LY79DRAFT_183863 [Colletotrichum navitas]|uniref:Uncharacterized protein n=1 Tax=Colletotrichum navitas TaxID=681940 RepID=A0AAD8Q118_9PEZI|nr:uncharacterized protein LY79DRAFT_183863 [Colletotrichum navitas]KAK1593306.1 hypothetical protein LY79DRAFT_183863 [Colletotrichum navitas]